MRYQGGKSRIAKQIAEILSVDRGGYNTFVSLFCGSCSVESKVNGFENIILNDNHEYLISLLKGVQSGYNLPEYISEEDYKYIKAHKDDDKVLSGFVGFGCSFGGKWWGGYARNKNQTNYALQSKKSLLKDMATLQDATIICSDYKDVVIPENSVVYADPPYANTTKYHNKKFDSESFWGYMRTISKEHIVFISEQNAPDDFISIWEKQFTRTLDVNKNNQFKVQEKLFVHENSKYFQIKQEQKIV